MGKKIDLTNKKFNHLYVLGEVPFEERTNPRIVEWYCLCDCGKRTKVRTAYLNNGHTKSCGCRRAEAAKENFTKDIKGIKFTKLTALEPTEERGADGSIIWKCQCDCGNIHYASTNSLTTGAISSCGCMRSKGELIITQLLTIMDIPFKRQYHFDDLKDKGYLYFDFAIFNNKNELVCLLEYQGEQHFNNTPRGSWNSPLEHDLMKKEYCEKNKIKLIEIPYYDFDNLSIAYLENKLK